MKSMTSRKSISLVALTTSILSASILSYQPSATAAELKFSGGTYRVIQASGNLNFDNFKNLTGKTVDGLYLNAQYEDTSGKIQKIMKEFNDFSLPSGKTYNPDYNKKLIDTLTVDFDEVKDTGTYWTKCGEKVSDSSKESVIASMISSFSNALIPPASAATTCPGVPEPSSAPATIIFGTVLGTSIFLKRKQLMRLTQKNGVQKTEAMKA
ncbi:MAG: hypothetical protein KA716_11925 [Gloeotrichia echinulata DEX184]|nr:hypothetical protein [Gloeotrichia echinulata DEX184]